MKTCHKSLIFLLILIPIIVQSQLKTDSLILEYNLGHYSKAIAISEHLLIQQVDSFQAFYYKGLSEQALCRFKEAESSFKKALALAPDKVPVLFALGNCQESAGNEDQALQSYSEILTMDSLNVPSKVRMASIFISQKEYSKAIETYSQLIALDSTNGYFYLQLAYCCNKFGFNEPVLFYLEKALELNPGDINSAHALISELVERKEYDEAQRFCDSFLMLYPDQLKLLKQQAYISSIRGEYLEAEKQFLHILALGDSSQFTYKHFGQNYFNNGQFPEAIIWLDHYLQKQPDDAKNQYIMGLACQKDYQYEKSIDHFEKALNQIYDKPSISEVFEEYGNTYSGYADYIRYRDSTKAKAGPLYQKALESYLKAESVNPEGLSIYKTIGRFYNDKLKDPNRALYYYQKYQQKINPLKTNADELKWLNSEIEYLKTEVPAIEARD